MCIVQLLQVFFQAANLFVLLPEHIDSSGASACVVDTANHAIAICINECEQLRELSILRRDRGEGNEENDITQVRIS